jgi:hypothetical protein
VGLDRKHWPQARDSWPRVVVISAEAASGDDFLQWAADLRVQGRLDRVVIDECHLTFTAAYDYRKKLRGLVRLRSLGCPFVFLTGTLPPLSQRDFEGAMHLQEARYIRAPSHRTNTKYCVLRIGNGRWPMEVRRMVQKRVGSAKTGEKGVIYCGSREKCKVMAKLLGCHYYHGEREAFDAHFLAQREAGFQSWLRGETTYTVATAALGTGIDVPCITHVITVAERDPSGRVRGRYVGPESGWWVPPGDYNSARPPGPYIHIDAPKRAPSCCSGCPRGQHSCSGPGGLHILALQRGESGPIQIHHLLTTEAPHNATRFYDISQ